MKRLLSTLALLCLATSFLAAASKVTVITNSYGTYNIAGKHFYIIPGSPSIDPKDAEYKDYANHVASMLRCSGAMEVSDPTTAELCVLIDYCVTDHSYIEMIPVPIRKAVGSVTTTHVHTDKQQRTETYDGKVDTKSIQSKTHSGNSYTSGDYGATVAHRTIYDTVGYKTEEHEVVGFRRILNVYVYDNVDNDGEPDMLWKCNMMSDGSRNSLNSIVPVMTYLNLFAPGKKLVESKSWVNIDYGWAGYEAYTNLMKDYAHAWFPVKKVEDKTWVYFVKKTPRGLTVTVRQDGPGKRVVTNETYLTADGVNYPVTAINHIKPGRKTRIEKDENFYFTMTFEGVPEDVEVFDLICPEKFEWNNIVLR